MSKIFKEFVKGPVRHTAEIKELNEIADNAKNANGEAMFMSVYDFTEDYADYAKENKSVANYNGPVSISKLFFDIDIGDGTEEECLNKARNLVNELMHRWSLEEYHVQPWFSGAGFHIITPDFFGFGKGEDVPDKVKLTLTRYFKDIDPVVYDKIRLLRMGNSKNAKTNLFKIPLDVEELNRISYEGIKILAKNKRSDLRFYKDWSEFKPYHQDKIISKPFKLKLEAADNVELKPTYMEPSNYVTCCQKMYDQGPVKGKRHTTALRLSSWLRRAGLSASVTTKLLTDWLKAEIKDPNTKFSIKEVKSIVTNTYKTGYFYWCNDPLMTEYCDSKCVYYENRKGENFFKNNDQISSDFADWYMSFNHDNSIDIGKFCGSNKPWWANPGELIIISGDSGAGKSAFMQNLILSGDLRTAYYQMEMGEELDRLRFNKIHFKMDDDELKEHFSTMSRSELIKSQKVFRKIYLKSAAPNADTIKREVSLFEPKVIVIDTMDMINSFAKNRLDQQRDVVIRLKKLSLELNCIIFAICHKNKSSSDTKSEFYNNENNAIAGDGSIFQKADKILFVTAPRGQTARDRSIISSKNRNEGLLNEKMWFTGEKMLFEPLKNL